MGGEADSIYPAAIQMSHCSTQLEQVLVENGSHAEYSLILLSTLTFL
jgi:hypothetical protein